MLTLPEIEKFYPESLRGYKRFLLREYLQHKVLQIVFNSEFADKLAFLGGTCLRIVHGNTRFSYPNLIVIKRRLLIHLIISGL